MIEPFLKTQLEPVTQRQRRWRLWKWLASWWALVALVGLPFLLLNRLAGDHFPWAIPVLALVAIVGAMAMIIRAAIWEPDYRAMARAVERRHPGLHSLLVTAVEQEPDPKTGHYGYLQRRVIDEAIAESRRQPWFRTVSTGRLAGLQLLHLLALALLLAMLTGFQTPDERVVAAFDPSTRLSVTPGDAEVEKGKGLVVMARFEGPPPGEVVLEVSQANQETRQFPLVRSMEDPVFGGSIPSIEADLTYRLLYGGQSTRAFAVTVYDFPALQQADATLRFPDYAGKPPQEIKDTRRISAVEGSRLDLDLKLNKTVASARLIPRGESESMPLVVETNRAAARLIDHKLSRSETYRLELVDAEGRTNRVPAQFIVKVLGNERPKLKILAPPGDQRVSALEEVTFQGEASDDFGLLHYGLHYDIPGGPSEDVTLGRDIPAHQTAVAEHLLPLEAQGVEPDQLIAWHFWADDIGPDGEVRRTHGDLYFSEVRPFEEIYREGAGGQQQQQQQGQQGGNQAMQLAETQKEIIHATWKLIRRETDDQVSDLYHQDVTVIHAAQEDALAQAQLMKENATSLTARESLEVVEKAMSAAAEALARAQDGPAPLSEALEAEQAAYQALLSLAAREFQVTRGQQGGGGGGGQRNQRQLDQLELKQSENRYENERQASLAQTPRQQEQLQVLNRLKELARRQQDLNEELKELQNALEEARSEEEREEIRRRLKRLREEQQEILADVDELQQRMSSPQNRESMAESREQLEQTRSEVQQASEALANEAVPEALSSATRAERELETLRDEFREQTASQFSEQMREMRRQARDLARSQEEVREQLDAMNESRQQFLRDEAGTEELARRFADQQAGLTNLLSNMRTVSEQAEDIEPLLSRELEDTYRDTLQSSIGEDLEIAQQLVERKFSEEAVPFETRAREELESLRESVEQAAASVLGDDVEALRLARSELEELARQVEEEMRRSRPQVEQAAQNDAGATNRFGAGGALTNAPAGMTGGSTNLSGLAGSSMGGQTNATGGLGAGEENPRDQASVPDRAGTEQAGVPGQDRPPSGQEGQLASAASEGEPSEAPGGQSSQGTSSSTQEQAQQAASQPGGQQPGQDPSSEGQEGAQQAAAPSSGAEGQGQGQRSGQGGSPQPTSNQQASSGRPEGGSQGGGRQASNQASQGGNFFDQFGGSGPGGWEGPLTGDHYREWSDRLRNVEEVVDVPELRQDVARIADQARLMRSEFKRHGAEPQWDLVATDIVEPMRRLQRRISEELARRESPEARVPIDRDPVPSKYSELVRRYYERLGTE